MGLNRVRLGDLIEQTNEFNASLEFGASDVMGMTITKQIIPTKANVNETDLRKFIIVRPNDFIYNPRTHGKHIGFGFNNTDKSFLISWNNSAFRVKESKRLCVIPEYLFLHFNRDEWDREACYRSWGSSTEVFTWNALCEMEIDLPPLEIQQKYVDVYRVMLANQASYERGLDDLKLACDAYIEKLRKTAKYEKIGKFLTLCDDRNDGQLGVDSVMGINVEKRFIPTKADMSGVSISQYKKVKSGSFAYVADTSRRGDKISLAYNDSQEVYLVSPIYTVFEVTDLERLSPQYLYIHLNRTEFDRYARFNSWGSVRETFDWEQMRDVEIPIPPLSEQRSIVKVYESILKRRNISEKIVELTKSLCPILIKGSIEEVG